MDTDDSGATGTTPAPAPHGRASSRASSALAAMSIVVILLYLIWRFMWQYRKPGARSNSTGAAGATISPPTSSARPPSPSCPSRDDATAAAYGAGEAARSTPRAATTTTSAASPVSVLLVRVAAARFGSAEKLDCAVCLAELGDGGGEDATTRLVPGCGHGFHTACIEAWFRVNSTCPLCRAAVAVAADADAAGQGAGEAPQYVSSV